MNNAIQFENNPLMASAMTFGNVIVYGTDATMQPDAPRHGGAHTLGQEEAQHTYQAQLLGPLYFPAHIASGLTGPGTRPILAWSISLFGKRSPHAGASAMALRVQFLRLFCLLVLAALLLGCPASMRITVVNNHGSEVLLLLSDGDVALAPGEEIRFEGNIDRLHWQRTASGYGPTLWVRDDLGDRQYELLSSSRRIPPEFIEMRSGQGFSANTEHYRYQLEGDGRLYLADPTKSSLIQPPPPQPPGFPIEGTPL